MATALALLLVTLAPLAGAGLALQSGRVARTGRAVTMAGGVAFIAALFLVVASGLDEDGVIATIEALDASVGPIAALLLAIITGTAAVVAGFSSRSLDDDGRAPRYFALIGLLTSGSTLVVVPAWPVLLVLGWLVSGWALIGLVGFETPWQSARQAQRRIARSLLVGDLALISGVGLATLRSDGILTGNATAAIADLQSNSVLGVQTLHLVMVLLVIAGASRSALLPFHRWLIGTLAAPTPVSALVHAGLVSGAGLLLVRFAAPFVASDPAVVLAFGLGVVTVVVATGAMLVRSDVKGALAWSTVAQMAFMVLQCSVGAFSSAIFHIAGHGMYKASLFLGAGDAVSAGLRSRRRPPAMGTSMSEPTRLLTSAAIGAAALALVAIVVRPDVSPAGEVLVFVFAWLTVAAGLQGWLQRAPFAPPAAIAVGVLGSVAASALYIGGLRLAEYYVKPSLLDVPTATVIGPVELMTTLVMVALVIAVIALAPGSSGIAVRDGARRLVIRLCDTSIPRATGAAGGDTTGSAFSRRERSGKGARRSEIRADVAQASAVIGPQWPLASFVAVNPLGGLESLGFEQAAEMARRWRGGRTHLALEEYRRDHQRGLTRTADLHYVVHYRFTDLCEQGPVIVDGQAMSAVDIIVADLLHGPEGSATAAATTALSRWGDSAAGELIDDVVSSWLLAFVHPPHWKAHRKGESFVAMSRRMMPSDPRLRTLLSPAARAWIADLDDDAASVIDQSFTLAGVADDNRIDEIRGHLCRLAGWSGLAKWRTEWAHPDESRPPLSPIDIVAVRSLLEASVIGSGLATEMADSGPMILGPDTQHDEALLEARITTVAAVLAPAGNQADRAAIGAVLAEVPATSRSSMWLDAQERAVDARLLSTLDRLDPGKATDRPDAQLVFCIDVRSEGLRSHIESLGNESLGSIETLGFAGFFGVPMHIRKLGWEHHEARCPVLVSPAIGATEQARTSRIENVAGTLRRQRTVAGLLAAHKGAKYGPGSPFALAETAGWILGPNAARRTFLPPPSTPEPAPATRMILDDDEVLLEQRTFFAESVLNTMGLTDRFAPLVMLCGHTSRTTNNAHATALECGACAGASGDDNARAVATLLNSPDVRHGLAERGITIPDDTWFLAGLHDTASDRVTVFDAADLPSGHHPILTSLEALLETAGHHQAAARAQHLPGPATRVRERGADWAQVRPEWGLARNSAFIIGPRSMTAGIDLEGRAFLHSYDAENDPTGRVLETIMTAPLIVGHWISAQYYFSTVDPDVFGAGNKLLHNPVGTTGVISGDRGDLRVGLPLQSTHVDGERFHQPVRLLAVIQADLVRIETIIANNPILRTLTGGSWIRIAARSHPDERWSTRTPSGTWIEMPRAFDPEPGLTTTGLVTTGLTLNKEHT